MLFIGESPPPRAKPIKSFGQAFSKACSDPTRARWSPSAEGEIPNRSKRHRRVNFKSCKLLKEGGPVVGVLRQRRSVRTAQVGGSPFCTKAILFLYPLFSLTHEAQRKKLSKKETPRKISPRARGDQRSARWIGGRFLKKAT